LSKIGVNNKILNSIKALYKNIQCSVRINNDLTPPFPMTNGVKQGCPLSPTLFNIFINDLIDYLDCYASEGLNFGKCKLNALLYADDIVLIAENPETLDKLLKTLTRWCLDNGMSINHDKTKIVHFRSPKKEICRFSFSCCGNDIDYTDSYKYLGIEFTEHLSWIKLVDNVAISANRAANYLIAKAINSGALVYEVFTHLYSMLVLPIIEYSSFLWGHTPYTQIAKIQNNLVRSFLGVNRSAPIVAMLGDMGWLPMLAITQISCIRFWLRLRKMSEDRLNQRYLQKHIDGPVWGINIGLLEHLTY